MFLIVPLLDIFYIGGDPDNSFQFNGHTLITTGPLDYESGTTAYTLDIQVSDTADHVTTVQVDVDIGNINDNHPACTFGEDLYVNLEENLLACKSVCALDIIHQLLLEK